MTTKIIGKQQKRQLYWPDLPHGTFFSFHGDIFNGETDIIYCRTVTGFTAIDESSLMADICRDHPVHVWEKIEAS